MPRTARLTAAACAFALAGTAAVAAAQSGPAPTAPADLSFRIPRLHSSFVDTGKRGPTSGDSSVDTGTLEDLRSGAHLGTVINSCVLAKVGRHDGYSCLGGLVLSDGRITMALVGVVGERVSTFAITGGSGRYATARGTVVTTPLSKADGGPSRVDVHVRG